METPQFTDEEKVLIVEQPVDTLLLTKTGITVKVLNPRDKDNGNRPYIIILQAGNKMHLQEDTKLHKWSADKAVDYADLAKEIDAEGNPLLPGAETETPPVADAGPETPEETETPGQPEPSPTEEKPKEKPKKQEDTTMSKDNTVSMSSIIMPMLEEKTHTADVIAKKVKKAFPDKYSDDASFKKLVQQIKGPRLYNAKKSGKDVGVVTG